MPGAQVEQQYLSPKEVAEYLGCGYRTVWRIIRTGELPAVKVGSRVVRVDRDALKAWLKKRAVPTVAGRGVQP